MKGLNRITTELAKLHLGSRGTEENEESRVLEHIESRAPISKDSGELAERQESRWDKLADNVARIGGSWPFIATFILFLALWTGLNGYLLGVGAAFDPYPYRFLNLVLSMVAALQAPIIMMSQNRQAEKDRIAASHDYEVNLRSEIEILGMQQKLDALRGEQHDQILAQQALIMRKLEEIASKIQGGKCS